jgi:hypothetical protein
VGPTKAKGRVALVLGAVLLVAGIGLGIVLAVTGVVNMARAVEDYQRVPVPGGGSVELTETGTHHLFFERPDSLAENSFFPPSRLTITGPDGEQLAVRVGTSTSTYDFGERHGRSIGTFVVEQPGTHQIRVVQSDGDFGFDPSGEIAVSPDSPFGEIGLVLGGAFGGGAMVLVGITLLIIGGVRRSRSKQASYVAAGGGPGWGGPATGGWTPPGPQPWTPPGSQSWTPPPTSAPWTPPPTAAPPPPPGWVPPPAPPADPSGWPPPSDGPVS